MTSTPAASSAVDQLGDVVGGPALRRAPPRAAMATPAASASATRCAPSSSISRPVVAARDRAKARDERVLAAGDALHDRVFDAAVTSVAAEVGLKHSTVVP